MENFVAFIWCSPLTTHSLTYPIAEWLASGTESPIWLKMLKVENFDKNQQGPSDDLVVSKLSPPFCLLGCTSAQSQDQP